MGQRRSKLDRHAAELLTLRRAGASIAQLTRWLRRERDIGVAATTVGRWLDNVPARHIRHIDAARDFDALAARRRSRAIAVPNRNNPRSDPHGGPVPSRGPVPSARIPLSNEKVRVKLSDR